jgi:hypothetical protein
MDLSRGLGDVYKRQPLESENRPILVHPHGSLWQPLQAILWVRSHYPPDPYAIGPCRGVSCPL